MADNVTGLGDISYKFYQNEIEVLPVNAGTYLIKASCAEGDLYKAATEIDLGSFTITKGTQNKNQI